MNQRAGGFACDDWRGRGETWSDVEVYQAAVLFPDGLFVFPAQSRIQRKVGADAEIIVDEGIPHRLPKILVGVAEGGVTDVWYACTKFAEIRTGRRARE